MRLYVTLLLLSTAAFSDHKNIADRHAPIGVMKDHIHKPGEFMFSLRAVNMKMDEYPPFRWGPPPSQTIRGNVPTPRCNVPTKSCATN